jgi:mRNA-degrading endonuclease toxin of MazEF toxin-antitoxin module
VRKQRHAAPPELDRLELKVRRLLEAHDAWQRRAMTAEARVQELEQAVRAMATGELDPVALADQVRTLDQRNNVLRQRMQQAQEAVQRMLARLHFVEEER